MEQVRLPTLVLRGSAGGVLMGLANLVPGISGGTMLLATGVYTRFVQAVAEVTTLRFRLGSLVLLATVVVAAAVAIVLLAGPVQRLVIDHRWVMYALFLGLTLGGVPLVWRMARPPNIAVAGGAAVGFLVMAVMAFAQGGSGGDGGAALLVVAGVAGAAAMILPGISGAYLLLVLGQYEIILGAIDRFKQGQVGESMGVIVPVGIGVVVGVVGISNLVRWTLRRHEKATLGVLLGLLLGSVLGIWPFQRAVEAGEPRVYFAPGADQALAALGLAAVGFGFTILVDRLGSGRR